MASKKEEIFKKYGMDANGQVIPPSGRVAVNGLPSRDNETKEDIFKRYGMDAGGNVVEKRQSTPSWNIPQPAKPAATTSEHDEPTWWDRIKDTITGGAKSSLGSNMDAMGALYEVTQGGRTTRDKEQREWYAHQLERAETALRMYEEDGDEHMAQVQRAEVEQLREKVKAFDTVIEGQVQQKATTAARDLAADVTNSGSQDIERAKDGLGTVGQIVVDAGASMTQMAGDALARVALGGGGMLPFAMRAFGGGTQQARAEGATIDEQLLYGGAVAAKEVITEKMFNVALPWAKTYGKGSADDMVKSAIDKAVSRFAKTALGKRALGGGLTLAASGVTEGLEEFFGDWLEWQMPRIYDGDTATFTEQLAQAGYDFLVGSVSGLAGGAFDSNVWNYKPETTTADAQATQDMPKAEAGVNSPVEIAPLNEAPTGEDGVSLATDEQRQNVLENQKAIDKAQREASMAEQERRNAPPTAKVEGKLTLPDGRKISTYTSDEKGNAFWVTDEGTVKGEEQDSTVVGAANKWGGDIGRVIVEQYDGADEATYAAAADVFVELGIQSVDGEMTWDKAAEITGAFVDEVGLEHANALYSAGVSAARSPAFRQYYHAGLIGNEMGSVSVQGKAWLSDAVRQYAYELGQAHAKDEKHHKYTVSKKAGFDSNAEGAKKLNRETRRVLDRIGKALGVEIRFATAEDHLSDDANGLYDAATGTIIISPNAANPTMVVVAHEVTHRLQDMDFEAYKQYRRFVIGKMEQRTGTMAVTKLRDRYRAFYGSNSFTDLQAMDELAADYTLAMIEDGNLFRELKEDNRSTARKLWSALKNFISHLTGSQPKGYSLYGTTIEELREAEKLWRGMLEGKQTEEGNVWDAVVGTRHSLKDGENRLENTQQQAYTETTKNDARRNPEERRRALRKGEMVNEFRDKIDWKEYYQRILSDEYNPDHFDDGDIAFMHLGNKKLTLRMLRNGEFSVEKMEVVEYGRYLEETGTDNERSEVSGLRSAHGDWSDRGRSGRDGDGAESGGDFGLRAGAEGGNQGTAASDSGKRSLDEVSARIKWLENALKSSRCAKKKKQTFRRELKALRQEMDERIPRYGAKKYSLKDSEGRQLSEAQAEFFKDSKVLDEDGNLKRLYHGTRSFGFTVFDKRKLDDGFSIFMTDAVEVAESYSGTLRVRSAVRDEKPDFNAMSAKEVVDWYNKVSHSLPINLLSEADIVAAREKYQRRLAEYVDKYRKFASDFPQMVERASKDKTASPADKMFAADMVALLDEFEAADSVNERNAIIKQMSDMRREYFKDASGTGWSMAAVFSYIHEMHIPTMRLAELSAQGDKVFVPSSIEPKYKTVDEIREELYNNDSLEDESGNYAVYANITNPFVLNGDGANWDELILPKKYRNAYTEAIGNDPGDGRIYVSTREIVKIAKHLGHDGVIFEDIVDIGTEVWSEYSSNIYVAFESNQVKDIDNLNPTEDEDIRYSLKADSEGKALTEEQAAYFANSKSVDAQGRLRVMYRGGNSGFTVFDRKKSSYSNLYGRGFYFTDSKSHAEQYGGARAFYLNITNPVPTDERTITKEQLLAFLRAVAENEDDYSFENYGYGATPESVVDAIFSGKSDFAMLYDVSQTAIGDMVEAVELFNEINSTDFDGLILDTETVTFRSEQAKLTSNETPTDDPDIRFSLVTEEQARENNKKALEHFGRTYNWKETGYILLDGSRLDFSGKHEGAPGGYRTVDHREIRDAFGDDYGGNGYSDSLVQFMREGNIRIMPESGGINLSVLPTKEQECALDDFISRERGEVMLDIDDDRGNTVASVEYPRGTRASKVLADIRKYFEDGTMPQVSELAQFRNSLKSDAAMGNTLRDMAEAEDATKQAVKAWIRDVHRGKKVSVSYDEAERVAKNLINDYRSATDSMDVTGAVLDLFNYLQNGDSNRNMDESTVQEKANAVAAALLSEELRGSYYTADYVETGNGMELSDLAQDNEELRAFLRETKIVYPKQYVSDLGTETWTEFTAGLKGARARLSDENNRANVDTLYRDDLSRMWPQYFPDSITGEAAMMQRIAEVSQRVFEREAIRRDNANGEVMTRLTAADVLDRFFNLPQVGKTYVSVRNLREKSTRAVRNLQNRLQVRDAQGSRAGIIRKVKALDKKLRDNTEKSHVPDYLRSAVLELCSIFTQNTSVFTKGQLAIIKLQYDALAKDENMQMVYDDEISAMLEELAQTLDGRRLSELKPGELQWVNDIVSHFSHLVNNANQAFLDDKRVAVADMANKVISKAVTDKKRANLPIPKLIGEGNIKPYYFFKDIGGQMEALFADLLNGQSRYGLLMNAAQEFRKSVFAKHNADKWLNSDKKLEMTTEHGDSLVLNVNEALSILATYKREVTNREQDAGHLTRGGIVYEDEMQREIDSNKKLSVKALINKVLQKPDAKAKPISKGDVLEISQWLRQNVSAQAEDFVDEMVSYLSNEMAELGNETSMKLSGIRKYMERYYFPYKVSSVYLATKLRDPKESPALRRPGFSKRTMHKANNPIVLRGFTDVWSEHVSEMLTYATMAIPQDTLLRVLNYNDTLVDVEDDTNIYKNVKEAIQNTYGKNAVEYIEQLLRDMNGGVAIDEREKFVGKLVRIYKKNAVGLSLSVAIQQPTSAVRALSEVDLKYFLSASLNGDYEQLKQYAGVAVIKEMSGFDTNLGRGGASWLKGDESFIEKAIGFLPQKMDQGTWAYLWNVVKAETRDKQPELLDNGNDTEAFLEAAGKRFGEVVESTQVYDSVLTRSENMRSKSGLSNLFLSFMSEPMVTLNMAVDAIRSGDKKRMGRVAGTLLMSIVFNNIVKALWTAGRDDEEEKTYLEKLVYRFNNYMSGDLMPWNYIPIIKDIDDIIKGYTSSIELYEPLEDVVKKYQKASEKVQDFSVSGVFSEETMDLLLALPSLAGVPLDNVKRDVETLINLFTKMAPIDSATKRDILNAFREGWGANSSVTDYLREGWEASRKGNTDKRKKALAEIEAIYQDKVRSYQKKGKTLEEAKKSAKSSIQTSCTNYLKPIYQSAKGLKKNEVKQFALRIGVGGKQLYADYDFSKWDE